MPGPISRRTNYPMDMAIANIARNAPPPGQHSWSNNAQQRAFNIAMAIIYRANASPQHRIQANGILRTLARNYGRTWNFWPRPANYMNSNYNSNSNSPKASNNSKVRKYAERWRFKGPVKLVNLPSNANNRKDPVNLHTFRAGQEAIMHQRRNAEGRVISTRYYLVPTIERLAGMKWDAIRRMHPNKVLVKGAGPGNKFLASKHVPNVITRLPMYRRHLTLVKFR